MKLIEYTSKWAATILPMKTPATVATFSSHIRKMNGYLGAIELTDLTESRIQDHVSFLSKRLSPRGLKNYIGTMKLILGRAKKEGLIESVPSPDLPKVIKKKQPWLTANQMKQIVDISEGQYKVLFYLLAETGLRIGEALGLQYKDINFENSSLTIERSLFNGRIQAPKTSNAIRTISISAKLSELLRDKTFSDEGFIFTTTKGSTLAANSVLTKRLHPSLRTIGCPESGFHSFRRGNATILAQLGVPEKIAATRLGHGIEGITFGLYAQSIDLADKPYVELIANELK